MQEDSKHTLCESTLYRIDSGAARIAAVWDALKGRGFSLIDMFFTFIDTLEIDDVETEPRKFYFEERARETLTCQYKGWFLKRRSQIDLFYRSKYLDWIETQHNNLMWRYAYHGHETNPYGPVLARYIEVDSAQSGPDRELANAYREGIRQVLDREANELLRSHPELIELRVGDDISGIKRMIELAFHGTGFVYDAARSTRAAVSYSRPIPDTEASIVCTFEGKSRFHTTWPWLNGIIFNDTKKSLANIKSLYPDFPITFELYNVFPDCWCYLDHFGDEKLKKLGCMFYATAMSLLADAICGEELTASAHSS